MKTILLIIGLIASIFVSAQEFTTIHLTNGKSYDGYIMQETETAIKFSSDALPINKWFNKSDITEFNQPSNAENEKSKDEPYRFSEVIAYDSSLSNDQIFERARIWFVNTFKDANAVLQVNDKQSGQLVGKGIFEYKPLEVYAYGYGGVKGAYIKFTMSIFIKDGRYKYLISDFIYKEYSSTGLEFPITKNEIPTQSIGYTRKQSIDVWHNLQLAVNENAKNLILSLKKGIATNTEMDGW